MVMPHHISMAIIPKNRRQTNLGGRKLLLPLINTENCGEFRATNEMGDGSARLRWAASTRI